MKAQQPDKNTIQLVALAITAAPSTFQNIMFWNIDNQCWVKYFKSISKYKYKYLLKKVFKIL